MSTCRLQQLHTVTYVTTDGPTVERIFLDGYGLSSSGFQAVDAEIKSYLGFGAEQGLSVCSVFMAGPSANIQIRIAHIEEETPVIRPEYLGLYTGGATISFPVNGLYAHEQRMATIGVESTIGVKEMDFASPTGETYTSAEIIYKAPDFAFVMGVKRPEIFIPTGPVDQQTGIGGAAYSARCVARSDDVIAFFQRVLGYEIRRDVVFEVGKKSGF